MMLREPWRTRLLFVSFAINLITIPMAAAPLFRHHGPHPPPLPGGPPRPDIMVERLSHLLAPPDQTKMREAFEPHYEQIDLARARMEVARAAMSRAIGHDPYDPEELRTAMRNWQVAWRSWSDQFGNAFALGIQTLSPDGRQRLAEAGRRRPQR